MSKKSERNIKKSIRELRKIIDDPKNDRLTTRVAYFAECTLRWAIEDTTDWERPEKDLFGTVYLIRKGE